MKVNHQLSSYSSDQPSSKRGQTEQGKSWPGGCAKCFLEYKEPRDWTGSSCFVWDRVKTPLSMSSRASLTRHIVMCIKKLSWKAELINHWGGSATMMKKITETSRADLNSGFQRCDYQRDCELSGSARQLPLSPNDLRESGQRLSSRGTIHNLNTVIPPPSPPVCVCARMCAWRGHSQHFLTSRPFPDVSQQRGGREQHVGAVSEKKKEGKIK